MNGKPLQPGGENPWRDRTGHQKVSPGLVAFAREAHAAFERFVLQPGFSCVGARAAVNSGSFVLSAHEEFGSDEGTIELCRVLFDFTRSEMIRTSEYATCVAVFRGPVGEDEFEFEQRLWQQLGKIHREDAAQFEWDPTVRSDPADPQFSFSFAGQSLYVVGLHPESSRVARQFPWPALVFNPHAQFQRLREAGKWRRMQETIRERELALQGSLNPMVSDFGENSEARQYSGREVDESWRAPFIPVPAQDPKSRDSAPKCPFAH